MLLHTKKNITLGNPPASMPATNARSAIPVEINTGTNTSKNNNDNKDIGGIQNDFLDFFSLFFLLSSKTSTLVLSQVVTILLEKDSTEYLPLD